MLRLIVQTNVRYKTKKEKETKEKSTKRVGKYKKKTLCATDENTEKKAPNKAQTVTKTVMFLSMKMKMMKLTNAKQKKIG